MRLRSAFDAAVLSITNPLALAKEYIPPPPTSDIPSLIPFSTFDLGNHSYAVEFTICYPGCYDRDQGRTRPNKAPQPFYEKLMGGCDQLGEYSEPATRGTQQMLVATEYSDCRQEFIFSDAIDHVDPVQSCLADVERPAAGRGRKSKDERDKVARSAAVNESKLSSGTCGMMISIFALHLVIAALLF
jgi:hypothetical protein